MADQQQQQAMQQHQQQQQHNSQMSTNNVAAHSNNGMSNVPSTVSSPRTVPNSPLSAQQLTGQPIPQVQVIPQAMHNQGQYVQFMFAQNPALAMQSGVNFAMAQQRPPAAHSGVGPRSPAMMGVVPPSPGAQMAGMHLVAPPGSQQPIPLTSPTAKSPARTPSMSPSVANVTGQRVISAETFQQMQHQQQQQQMQQQQQQQHMQHQQHMQQQQQQQQHLQQQKFFIRPIASGMQLVGQQPMSSQGATLQVQSPVGTVAPTTQHQMMNPPQIISTQSLLGGQPIYGQFIPQNIPVAHQQYVSNQGQAVLTTQPMYVRPTLQNQPAVQNLGPVMAPKVGRPRLDQSQRKTPPGVSLAAKRQASGQARVTPIATRMIKSQTPPMNLSVSRQHMRHEAPKNVRARMKAPVHGATISGLVASRAANLVRVPNPNFVRSTQNQTSAENFPPSAETKTVFSEDCNGNGNRCNDMPKLFSTLPPSTPLGEGMVDGEKQRAVVKPQTLTHVIDGFVIEEGPLAFPVQASSLITDTADLPPKLSRVSSRESEEEVFKPNPAPVEEEPKLKCEFCGKVDKMIKFHRSKRFCSVACAKRYNVGSRHQGIKKAKAATPALGTLGTGFVRKKMMKRTWKRGQGGRLAVSRLPLMEHQADDEHSTTSSSSSSHHEQEDRSSSVSTPLESSQDAARNNPAKWTVQEVYSFVKSMGGCEPYAEAFKSQEIDGQALMLLKEDHLMSAMNMKLGPALKICARINTMKVETS